MPRYFPAKEIQKGLWIGSKGDAENPDFYTKHTIGLQVNCTNSVPFIGLNQVDEYRVPVDDDTSNNTIMYSHFPVVVRAIDSVLQRGRGVLVHCHAGMQRSATVVAAYLMYKYGISADDAIRAIQGRKSETFWPTPTFDKALRRYDQTTLK